jgi:hypothetical protein
MPRICPLFVASLLVAAMSPACAADAPAEPAVKLSNSQICHVRGTSGYRQTKIARGFESLEACQAAGGRLPKNAQTPTAAKPPVDKKFFDTADRNFVKMSGARLCHDETSPSFDNTTSFKAYRTLQDCVDSGGKSWNAK